MSAISPVSQNVWIESQRTQLDFCKNLLDRIWGIVKRIFNCLFCMPESKSRPVAVQRPQEIQTQKLEIPDNYNSLSEQEKGKIRLGLVKQFCSSDLIANEIADSPFFPKYFCSNTPMFNQHILYEYLGLKASLHTQGAYPPIIDIYSPPNELKDVIKDFAEKPEWKNLDYFTSSIHLNGNHWTLLFIDRKLRTLEFYDSMYDRGNYAENEKIFLKLSETLTELDPGKPYRYERKIQKNLQNDGINCGPMICYFLDKRLKNANFDFNKLDAKVLQNEIPHFRKSVLSQVIESFIKTSINRSKEKALYEDDELNWIHTINTFYLENGPFSHVQRTQNLLTGKLIHPIKH